MIEIVARRRFFWMLGTCSIGYLSSVYNSGDWWGLGSLWDTLGCLYIRDGNSIILVHDCWVVNNVGGV